MKLLISNLGTCPPSFRGFEAGIQKTIQWYFENPGWVGWIKSGEYLQWMKKKYGQ